MIVATRIQKDFSIPFKSGGTEIYSTASIGIALGSREYARAEDLLQDADITMYQVKSLGGAQCKAFAPDMRLKAVTLLHLERDLRAALSQDELRIHYQPIVSLGDSKVVGLEALIRWEHPHRGSVAPLDFIPLAESTGLIVPIGEWVLRSACSQLKSWLEEGFEPLRIGVNISTVQLKDAGFADMVCTVLSETGINPEYLDLEITESVLIDQNKAIMDALFKLKSVGVHISLDDFGTGYSSLNYLHSLPIDTLKIDRTFINNLTSNNEQEKIVETILMLGGNLGLQVVAEGIENIEQLKRLQMSNCPKGQGYFFSKAKEGKDIRSLLSHQVRESETVMSG
jgi:EAL domain-containing protein (putative c-di-GMP-specific phosphodiesterase class I)